MSHTVRVQVVEGSSNLMGKLLGTLLANRELSLLQVAEQITTIKLLHDDVDVVLVLKDIEEANNVWMLTHFENFNFSSLQLDILHRHLPLGHDLDSHGLSALLVDSRLHKAELALAERLLDLVEVKDVRVPDDLLDRSHPTLFLLTV